MSCCKNKEEQILQKAHELFSIYGIRSISMDDLSTNLGISKKTLYRFVKDKEELIAKVVEGRFKTNTKKIEALLSPSFNAIEEILALIGFFIETHQSYSPNMIFDLQKYYPEVYQTFRTQRKKKLQMFFNNNFKKGIREGLYRVDIDANVATKIIIHLSETIIESDTFTIQEITSPSFIEELYVYHLHGIISEKGQEVLKKIKTNNN